MKKLAILCLTLFIVNGTQAQIFDKLKNAVSKGSSTTSTNSTTATSTANKLFNSGNSIHRLSIVLWMTIPYMQHLLSIQA